MDRRSDRAPYGYCEDVGIPTIVLESSTVRAVWISRLHHAQRYARNRPVPHLIGGAGIPLSTREDGIPIPDCDSPPVRHVDCGAERGAARVGRSRVGFTNGLPTASCLWGRFFEVSFV